MLVVGQRKTEPRTSVQRVRKVEKAQIHKLWEKVESLGGRDGVGGRKDGVSKMVFRAGRDSGMRSTRQRSDKQCVHKKPGGQRVLFRSNSRILRNTRVGIVKDGVLDK